jgi:soluble lytic murein transglycosylase-like protein
MVSSTTYSPVFLILSILFYSLPCVTAPHSLEQQIKDAAQRSSLDPALVKAVIQVESNFKSNATSQKGAKGLMQVMPQTAQTQGIQEPYHPIDNLMGACDYLRKLINQYRGNIELALAAYNAGPGNVRKFGGIPPFKETQTYVKKVMAIYRDLKSDASESLR